MSKEASPSLITSIENIEIDEDSMVILDGWAEKRTAIYAEFLKGQKEYDDPSKCPHRFIQVRQTLCAETIEVEHTCNQCGAINPRNGFFGKHTLPKSARVTCTK
jgi:hypothetical protein